MNKHAIWFVVPSLALGALMWLWLARSARTQGTAAVSGVVMELSGGAVVRQQTTTNSTTSAADGSFILSGLTEGITTTVTAWHEGYLVGGVEAVPPQTGITVTLKRHYTTDNPEYQWFSSNDPAGPVSCVHCMVAQPQWRANAHGNSGTNPRFFSMYNGTDITGTTTITPGYKLDFPDTAGNCATCHAPAAAARREAAFTTDMNRVEREGVFCEFCHKVGAVYLNPATGLPYSNAPGVLSMRLYRPPAGEQLFFGPFDDVTRRVSYLALEKQSQFCAPCHQFSFWGTPIYQSFKEWLESPYAAQGTHCQTYHMKPTGVNYFVYPEKGGLIHDPDLIASHLQPGASDVELLQNRVDMTISAGQELGRLQVTVTITNTGAGHHVPTDNPARHMLLIVTATNGQGQATSGQGQALPPQSGSTVPDWGGDYAGQPGKVYAKVLMDVATGEYPVASYWKQTLIVSDNRIPALAADTSTYEFAVPRAGGPITLTATLILRRAFKSLMEQKGWQTLDILMEQETLSLMTTPVYRMYLALLMR